MNDTLSSAAKLAGFGLLAGLAGTLIMTLGQKAEMALTGRKDSDAPARAVEAITGVDIPNEQEQNVSLLTHLSYGTALGLGLAALDGLPGPARGGLFTAGAWAGGAALQTALGVAEPPTRWKADQLATDLLHHAVYGLVAAAAFSGLRTVAARQARPE